MAGWRWSRLGPPERLYQGLWSKEFRRVTAPQRRFFRAFGATILEGIKMSDVIERVKKIVVERLEVDAEKVNEKASFIDDLGADSLDLVELVMAFEEEFGIEIPDDVQEQIGTVGDAVRFIKERV
jgi:acyl carrier protein